MNRPLLNLAAFFALLCLRVVAAPLDAGKVTRVVNDASVLGASGAVRRATADRVLRADEKLRTGAHSRAEISFADGTLARLGAETVLGFHQGTRELALERGTLLLETPAFRGGARVAAGSLAVVCGSATILVEHLPGQSLKLVVLAGEPRISSGGFFGDSIVVAAGKMLIAPPDAQRIPEPVDVDLATLVQTSALVAAAKFADGGAPLRSLPRIERAIARQASSFKARALIPTNLAIVGSGTNVVIPAEAGSGVVVEQRANEESVRAGGNEVAIPKSAEVAVHRGLQSSD